MEESKPNVLFILHLPPPVHGSSIVGRNIKHSERINATFDCDYINLSTSKAIDQIGKGGFAKIITFLLIIKRLLASLTTKRYELCYFAIASKGVAFYKDLLLVLLVKLFRVKLVYHLHNKGVSTRQEKALDNFLYRFTFHNASVILLSDLLYDDIKKYVPQDRVHICPNGIKEIDVKPNHKTNRESCEILFLSNLIKSKGVFDLIDACNILRNNNVEFECNFIGGLGDISKGEFDQYVGQKELDNCIQYLGPKYGEEKYKAFQHADIFAFPTYYHFECFPLVLLEAMSAGLPVVTTNEGGIPDVVKDGCSGFICDSRDVEKLAEKLETLIKKPVLREKMGRAGQKRYEEKFTIEQFESRLENILDEIIN